MFKKGQAVTAGNAISMPLATTKPLQPKSKAPNFILVCNQS
jgi:hypothetical protein